MQNPTTYKRTGEFRISAPIEKVFPLLCPKKEEDWIPGWECEVIRSKSGYNEEGAIFRTKKPYGTELYWNTITYDIKQGKVDFLIIAANLYIFRFVINVKKENKGVTVVFNQEFIPLTDEGMGLIEKYSLEDFGARLTGLQGFMSAYLDV